MRIISGKFKGRPLAAPKTQTTRPTTDKARESLFNILQHAQWSQPLTGRRVMDIYAGSGALGFEAISRGADFVLFIEKASIARGAIRENIEKLGLFGQTRLQKRDATRLGMRPANLSQPFDLVFIDPPYGKGLVNPTLRTLTGNQWLAPQCTLAIEMGLHDSPIAEIAGYTILEERHLGASRYIFLNWS